VIIEVSGSAGAAAPPPPSAVTPPPTTVIPPPTTLTPTPEPVLVKYVNRLSDLLFVIARVVNHRAAMPEVEW